MTIESQTERRLRRSNDPITALHYQLEHARHAAGLQAMVLVDTAGALVAGSGAWPVCEELAAFAPLLAQEGVICQVETASAAASLKSEVSLRALSVDGAAALLAARGPRSADTDSALARAMKGCMRILGTSPRELARG